MVIKCDYCIHFKQSACTLGNNIRAACHRFVPNVGSGETEEVNKVLKKWLLQMADAIPEEKEVQDETII